MNDNRPALAALCLAMVMPSLGTSIANASLPVLAQALGASFAQVQWVVLAYLLSITALIVGAGRLGDLLGRGRLLVAGVALFTVASLLCGLAPTLATLAAARVLQGLGAAAMLALTVALVGETMPRERTGAAMGLLGTMSAIGTTLGPSLGGLLTTAVGWRAIFLVNVPIGLLNLWLASRHLPMARPAAAGTGPRFDIPGTVLLAGMLAAYAIATTVGRGHALAWMAAALAGGLAFVAVEARAAAPLVRLSMFRDAALCAGLATTALVATVIATTLVVGPFYLSRALALPAGIVLSCGPMVSALAGAPAGRVVDRVGASRVAVFGLAAMVAGTLLLALLPSGLGVAGWLAGIVVTTVGYASFQAANNTALMHGAAAAQRGLVSGLLSLARNLGLVTGVAALGAVFAAASSSADVASAGGAAVARGMHITFAVDAGLMGIALAIALAGAWLRRGAPLAKA
ncbi:MFS transporter [Paracidovorax avenae]|uniref:MFS transporter n=1 Tax=Paracidovorax avenae TaxID=80867 RepID=UPI000D16C06C|nr:MFS transporter [Paracidovorax avenae]AVT14903.1 MFS transporter [Paracidovorax avenae]